MRSTRISRMAAISAPKPKMIAEIHHRPEATQTMIAGNAEHDRDDGEGGHEVTDTMLSDDVVRIDLTRPMVDPRRAQPLSGEKHGCPLGPVVVAHDIAHAKIKERLDRGEGLPQYLKDHAVYRGAGEDAHGLCVGFVPTTTAGRMDSYVDLFQENGGSYVMLAKGNRSKAVTDACKRHGGFYLGSIGGPAARLRAELHQEGRRARVSRARHGSGVAHRSEKSPRSWWSTTRATTSSPT